MLHGEVGIGLQPLCYLLEGVGCHHHCYVDGLIFTDPGAEKGWTRSTTTLSKEFGMVDLGLLFLPWVQNMANSRGFSLRKYMRNSRHI